MPTIHRAVLDDLRRDLGREEIAFLVGPRQAGKTTIMALLQAELERAGHRTLYLSLDFDADRGHFATQQGLLRKIALEIGPGPGYVFLDEIQRRAEAGLFLKGLHDLHPPYRFIVSGSGSVDVKARVRESMVGRARLHEVYPLSLLELVGFRTGYRYQDRLAEFLEVEAARADALLTEYLSFGGYPRVVLEPEAREKRRVMDDIFQAYLRRDIAHLVRVDKLDDYGHLLRTLAGKTGRMINYAELASTLGIALPTVRNYCWYAEETYVLRRLTPFFRNVRSEISKSPMVYFADLGFRHHALGVLGDLRRPDDVGFAFQNLVYLVLRDRLRAAGARLHYWRTTAKTEIDFVVDTGRRLLPIEVKHAALSRPLVPRAFDGFVAKYRPERCLVVNRSLRARTRVRDTEVRFLTVFDLLLEDLGLAEPG